MKYLWIGLAVLVFTAGSVLYGIAEHESAAPHESVGEMVETNTEQHTRILEKMDSIYDLIVENHK